MIREQGEKGRSVAVVKYLLEQPRGWAGKAVLRNPGLNQECGEPPKTVQVSEFKEQALQLIIKAGRYGSHFARQFDDTIKANGGTPLD